MTSYIYANSNSNNYQEAINLYNSSGSTQLTMSKYSSTGFSFIYKNMLVGLVNNHYANITSTSSSWDHTNSYDYSSEGMRVTITLPTTLNF